jgi:hypothetical protein
LIRKLVTITAITAAAITAITAAITAKTATIEAATATIDTARRRNIDLAAGRRRRRNIDLTAAATPEKAAAPIPDGTVATREVTKCIGPRRNSGGNECESGGGHDG